MNLRVLICAGLAVLISGSTGQESTRLIAQLPLSTRAAVVARAKTMASHPWICSRANLHAACARNYESDWKSGQQVNGIPYRWGGSDGPEELDKKLAQGLAAGSHRRDGVLSCTTGIDCSAFVSLCWGVPLSGHTYSTSNLRLIAGKPKYNWFTDMKPGDVLNKPGSHVVLFTGYHPDGSIDICEASGSQGRVVCHRTTWSRFKGYIPLQYKAIDE